MRKLSLNIFTVFLIAVLASCNQPQTEPYDGPDPVPLVTHAKPTIDSAADTAAKAYMPADLLTAAEASKLVGHTVTLDTLNQKGDHGAVSQCYIYDLPREGVDYSDTIYALLEITEDAMLSKDQLDAGINAKSSYDNTKQLVGRDAVSITGIGDEAFYIELTNQVHVLSGDYYIVVAFEGKDDAESLALNKNIADYVVDQIDELNLVLPGLTPKK